MLAGVTGADIRKGRAAGQVSYKPQYITPDFDGTVTDLFNTYVKDFFETGFFQTEIQHPMMLKPSSRRTSRTCPEANCRELHRTMSGKGSGHLPAG